MNTNDIVNLTADERRDLLAKLRAVAKAEKAEGREMLHNRTCKDCGAKFTTEPTRGRPPVSCPTCRAARIEGALAKLRAKSPGAFAPVPSAVAVAEDAALATLAASLDDAPISVE